VLFEVLVFISIYILITMWHYWCHIIAVSYSSFKQRVTGISVSCTTL